MDDLLFQLMQLKDPKRELARLVSCNERTEKFNLILTPEEANELIIHRNESLKKYKRVEFGEGILDKLIDTFCDSQYINQDDYLETLTKLQDIFYEFKNESEDHLTDDELLTFMKEQYETVCYGDLDYLEGTCLIKFSEAIRAGYRGYKKSGGKNEYYQFDEVARWDGELYYQVLKELFWG